MRKSQLAKLAAEMGAKLEDDLESNGLTIRATAPRGMIWRDGVHQMVEWTANGNPAWYAAARRAMAERMKMGLEPCTIDGCYDCPE